MGNLLPTAWAVHLRATGGPCASSHPSLHLRQLMGRKPKSDCSSFKDDVLVCYSLL